MHPDRLKELLGKIAGTRIGVIGDFCLDAYWVLDVGDPELSLETGKPTRAVREQRYSLGGAGNVAANLSALGVRSLCAASVVADDLFGREINAQLREWNVDTSGMVAQTCGWSTPVYAKPHRGNEEQERIDFGRWNSIAPETEHTLARTLRAMVPRLDAVIVNQQLAHGIYSPAVVRAINECAADSPSVPFLLDARTMSDNFPGMTLKVNAREAARLCAPHARDASDPSPGELRHHARRIASSRGRAVYITRSNSGILLSDGRNEYDLPALRVEGPTDPVGAGDATVSAIAAALAAGATHIEAGELGNIAAAVTVTKLRQTGTATPAEILAAAARQPRPAQ